MTTALSDAWRTVVPDPTSGEGPLTSLLVALTTVTGLVDAFSYLQLGHVFVANMTGNVVFLSFDLGGAHGFVWWASLLAIAAFVLGALVGGRIRAASSAHRARHVMVAATVQTVLLAVGFAVSLLYSHPYRAGPMAALIVVLGIGMGVQNATARALSIRDLTTTVLTLTLTGISADSSVAGGRGSNAGRRLVSVGAMFLGGLIGAILVTHGWAPLTLLLSTLLVMGVALTAATQAYSTAEWTRPPQPAR
ncbi:YoaK family protein [Gordonia jinhuaensis]|uniref:Membrane protein n=1 Tax=Gordonia jinhuaensis TaxID=1517702 RepID=A0A916WP30_9ACTN|nr:YoaK family protein [Gordonia jinhuaensis]GGB16969.1 membrane protein [Gordonia jinhuaensis]